MASIWFICSNQIDGNYARKYFWNRKWFRYSFSFSLWNFYCRSLIITLLLVNFIVVCSDCNTFMRVHILINRLLVRSLAHSVQCKRTFSNGSWQLANEAVMFICGRLGRPVFGAYFQFCKLIGNIYEFHVKWMRKKSFLNDWP